jgi:SWI/SNF-related matrix-associated actin-dependent regulator of chromatin subfamily A member 5
LLPLLSLAQINYGANKGKAYTEEEDRFIICSIAKLGYGSWDDLKADIRKSWKFRCAGVMPG